VAGRLLGLRGALLGLYCINVFVVWVECVKALLVKDCNGTAKSAEIVSRDTWGSPLDNTLILLGGEFPFIYLFGCVGGVLVGDCS